MISTSRIWAVFLRHVFNFRHSLDRMTDAFYWPVFDLLIWGMTFYSLAQNSELSNGPITMILTASVLWYVIWRGQSEISIGFLEELWSQNIVNFFATPLRMIEWVLATCLLGLIKLSLTIAITTATAWFLYGVNFFALGWSIIPFVASLLIFGWVFGLFITSIFLRYGSMIQILAWAGGFAIMPFSAVFYSLNTLPIFVQRISVLLPSTYIFESMRELLVTGVTPWDMVVKSFALNGVYLVFVIWFFSASFKKAKENGLSQLL